ncbi:MAG: type II toxin-antitoxin system VapC family toxin [Anaerolineae bacterium]|nr:type II toxin-antitoxin system VapC family toxin [Anaerolineae bacterium]
MTTFYTDSSALVKRYVTESGSDWLQTLVDPAAGHTLVVANIGLVEIAAALAAKQRHGVLAAPVLDGLLRDLHRDARDQYWLVEVNQAIISRAMALIRRQKLRGYDAVHLACALFTQETLLQQELPALTLLSADLDLLAAAQAEGLMTANPNDYP